MRYIPVIEASDGREYTNRYYATKKDARRALENFINIFKETNDSNVIKAYVRKVKM